jgi:hypothetical protein
MNCSNPSADIANYGKFSVSWTSDGTTNTRRKLQPWLDPAGTNPTTLDGKSYVSITGPTSICSAGTTVTYTISNKPTNATVTWSCNNLTITSANGTTSNSATFTAKRGTGWVQAVINSGGTSYTLPQFPVAIYDFGGTLKTGGQTKALPTYGAAPLLVSTGYTSVTLAPSASYSWSLASGSTPPWWSSSDAYLNFQVTNTTDVYHFTATMQSTAGCVTKTVHYYFTANPNIGTGDGRPMSYYYDPSSNLLTVDFGEEQQVAATQSLTKKATTQSYLVKIFNLNGSLIMQGTSTGESVSLNLSGKPNGIYIVNVYDANSNSLIMTAKFLKEY